MKVREHKMCSIYFIRLIAIYFTTISIANGDQEQKTTYYKTFSVYQYNNVGSLVVITHTVEENAVNVLWSLSADRSDILRCPTKSITAYLQHGSIPVAQYENNSTYGEEFTLSRSYLYGPVHISANHSSESIGLLHPPAGTWFLATFLDDNQSQVIKKITNVDCHYFLRVDVTQTVKRDVKDLSADVSIPFNITARQTDLRFYVSSTTYAVHLQANCIESITHCPILIRTRRAGFPLDIGQEMESHRRESLDCTDKVAENCRLTVVNPDVEQWFYISITLTNNDTKSLFVAVTVNTSDFTPAELNSLEEGDQIANYTALPYMEVGTISSINSSSSIPYVALRTNDADQSQSSIRANEVIVSSDINARSVKLASADNTSIKHLVNNAGSSESNIIIEIKENKELSTENSSASMLERSQSGDNNFGGGGTEGGASPLGVINLSRLNDEVMPLHTIFSVARDAGITMFMITDNRVTLIRFDIDPFRDIGSTLKIRTGLPTLVYENSSNSTGEYNLTIQVCIQKGRLPVSENGSDLFCSNQSDSISRFISLSKGNSDVRTLIPFPEPGAWFIAAQRVCYRDNVKVNCDKIIAFMLQTYTFPCAGTCANGAKCVTYAAGIYEYAACNCIAGYKGFSCSDDSAALSRTVQLIQTLLLTVSNLCFIPAICVAIVRRRPAEAVIYFCNMFFSSFYHACDMSTWSVYVMCIMPYHVLSFCDFLCSLMSFWVTLIAVARVQQWMAHVAHLVAGILLAMAVKWNTHGLVTNLVPIGVGCLIIALSWGIQSWRRKEFVPGRHAVLCLIPGGVIAVIGLCLFAFVENDSNYPYTHSTWHTCMSISIVFLLPRKKARLSYRGSRRTSLDAVVDQENVKLVAGSNVSSDSTANNINVIDTITVED